MSAPLLSQGRQLLPYVDALGIAVVQRTGLTETPSIGYAHTGLKKYSTTSAATKLGLSPIALSRYIAAGKVPSPEIVKLGRGTIHLWTEAEIEHVRQLLPKIANGRKTRYKKKRKKK